MLDPAHLFITASGADVAFLDRLALTLPGWNLGIQITVVDFAEWIITKSDFPKSVGGSRNFVAPLTSQLPENKWVGCSVDEVIAFVVRQADQGDGDFTTHAPFLIVDQQGKEDGTCIVVGALSSSQCEAIGHHLKDSVSHWKMRMPWEQVYTLWCNIWVGTSTVESFAQYQPPDANGWFTYKQTEVKGSNLSTQKAGFAERDRRIREVEERRAK